MAAPRKKIEPAAPSRFAALQAEARAKQAKVEPYMFDAVEPAVPISPPSTVEQVLAVAEMLEGADDPDVSQYRQMFAIMCGDAFPVVWNAIKDEPVELMFLLVDDMTRHFNGGAAEGDVPGGA